MKWFGIILLPFVGAYLASGAVMPLGVLIAKSLKCDGFGCLVLLVIPITLGWVLPLVASVIIAIFLVRFYFRDQNKSRKAAIVFVAGFLIPLSAMLGQRFIFEHTNLNAIVHGNDTSKLKQVIEEPGFDPNTPVPPTNTPVLAFILCNQEQHESLVPVLLANPKVDVNLGFPRTESGYSDETPYTCALQHFQKSKYPSDILSHPSFVAGTSELFATISRGTPEMFHQVLSLGKFADDIRLPSLEGRPQMLGAAVQLHRADLVPHILKLSGIDPNFKDDRGSTPLWYAMSEDEATLTALLADARVMSDELIISRASQLRISPEIYVQILERAPESIRSKIKPSLSDRLASLNRSLDSVQNPPQAIQESALLGVWSCSRDPSIKLKIQKDAAGRVFAQTTNLNGDGKISSELEVIVEYGYIRVVLEDQSVIDLFPMPRHPEALWFSSRRWGDSRDNFFLRAED